MLHSCPHNFHDGHLASFTLGPRREITLEIALNPVWNRGGPPSVSIRFGAIENYEDVASFFCALPEPARPGEYIAEIVGLGYVGKGPNWVVVDVGRHGHVEIHSHHVAES